MKVNTEAVAQRSSVKKLQVFSKIGVLKNFAEFMWKHLCQSSFFNKVAGLRVKALAQMFFYELWKMFKNTYFYRTPLVAVSVNTHFLNSFVFSWRLRLMQNHKKHEAVIHVVVRNDKRPQSIWKIKQTYFLIYVAGLPLSIELLKCE